MVIRFSMKCSYTQKIYGNGFMQRWQRNYFGFCCKCAGLFDPFLSFSFCRIQLIDESASLKRKSSFVPKFQFFFFLCSSRSENCLNISDRTIFARSSLHFIKVNPTKCIHWKKIWLNFKNYSFKLQLYFCEISTSKTTLIIEFHRIESFWKCILINSTHDNNKYRLKNINSVNKGSQLLVHRSVCYFFIAHA